jgi:hypothetical protein
MKQTNSHFELNVKTITLDQVFKLNLQVIHLKFIFNRTSLSWLVKFAWKHPMKLKMKLKSVISKLHGNLPNLH